MIPDRAFVNNEAQPSTETILSDGTSDNATTSGVPHDATEVQDTLSQEVSRDLSSEAADRPGSVPGYELIRRIGRGAFGEVWLAEQQNTGKRVAVKLYTRRRRPDWPLLAREVEKLAALDATRNVVNLLEVGWDHDPPYFVMEHLEGGSLAEVIERGPLPADRAASIAIGIARGLVRAHGAGILHCDLKPANVLIDADGEPRLCDFGQSRLATEQDPTLGTLFYMSPEQSRAGLSEKADETIPPNVRWDVYAFGAVLYHMLTGSPPHRGEAFDTELREADLATRLATYADRVSVAAIPEVRGVDKELAGIVRDCLRPEQDGRSRNMQLVLSRLEDRAAKRQRRPVVMAGFALPILFALALLLAAWRVVPQTVRTTEDSLIAQKLNGDAVSARLLAAAIAQDIHFRMAELESLAELPQLQAAIVAADGRPYEERTDLVERIDAIAANAEERFERDGKNPDQSWFVLNRDGYTLHRNPFEGGLTIDKRFAHRDYYHGLEVEFTREEIEAGKDVSMRSVGGVSTPFRSEVTKKYMVALAVPVRDKAGDPLGLLTRTIHLDDLLDDWEANVGIVSSTGAEDRSDRQLVLVDLRSNQILDHAWLESADAQRIDTETLRDVLHLSDELHAELTSDDPPRFRTDYRDPVSEFDESLGGSWLASFALVGDFGWATIVQERKTEAIEPVEQLRKIFVSWGLVLAGVFVGLLLLFWWLLSRRVRRGGAM